MAGNAFLPPPQQQQQQQQPRLGLDASTPQPGASCDIDHLDPHRDDPRLHDRHRHPHRQHAHHPHHQHHQHHQLRHSGAAAGSSGDLNDQDPLLQGPAASAAAHGAQHAHHRFPGRLPHEEWRREFHHNVMQKLFKEQRDRKVESNRNMSVIETDSDSEKDVPDLPSQETEYLKRLIEDQWRLHRESGNIPPEFASQAQPPPEFAERLAAEIIRQGQLQGPLQ